MGINDKRDFVQLNGPTSGFKGTGRFLKAALLSTHDFVNAFYFRNLTKKGDDKVIWYIQNL